MFGSVAEIENKKEKRKGGGVLCTYRKSCTPPSPSWSARRLTVHFIKREGLPALSGGVGVADSAEARNYFSVAAGGRVRIQETKTSSLNIPILKKLP